MLASLQTDDPRLTIHEIIVDMLLPAKFNQTTGDTTARSL